MGTIEGGIDVRNIGTSHPLSFCVVPVGYDVRLLRRCEPFAHGCYDQIGLALEGRSLRCGL